MKTAEELQAELEAAMEELEKTKSQLGEHKESVEKLERKRTELLMEKDAYKKVAALLQVAGVDPLKDDAPNAMEEWLKKLKGQGQEPPSGEGGQGGGTPPAGGQGGGKPTESLEVLQAREELSRMARRLEAMEKKAKEAEEAAEKEKKKALADRMERDAIEVLQKNGCQRSKHVYKLIKDKIRLGDGGAILAGPDYDPKTLQAFVEDLKTDDDFDFYFSGPGSSGSGAGGASGGSGGGGRSGPNPFSKDSLNATEAAKIARENPQRAKILVAEAQASGKLDPRLAKFLVS